MKFNRDPKLNTIAIYTFLVLAAAILFTVMIGNVGLLFGSLKTLAGFAVPVIYGFVFAYLLNPMLRMFDDRLLPRIGNKLKPSTRRGIAIVMTYLTALIFICLFLALVLPQLITSLKDLAADIPSYLKSLQTMYNRFNIWLAELHFFDDGVVGDLVETLTSRMLDAIEGLLETFGEWITVFGARILSATASFTSGVLDIVLGIIVSIYFLNDREKLFAQAKKIATAIFKEDTRNLLYDIAMDSHKIFSGFIVGKIIDSIIIGILCFICLSILGMPNVMLISVIIGVTNVIPYFGPFIGAIPGFLLVFISDPVKGPSQSFIFLIFILLLQQFDGNILGPKILGDTTGLSALWVIFSITFFSGLMGIPGMFIGVPLFAVIYSLARRFITYLLKRKNLPTDTRNYDSDKNPLIK